MRTALLVLLRSSCNSIRPAIHAVSLIQGERAHKFPESARGPRTEIEYAPVCGNMRPDCGYMRPNAVSDFCPKFSAPAKPLENVQKQLEALYTPLPPAVFSCCPSSSESHAWDACQGKPGKCFGGALLNPSFENLRGL